MVQHTVGIPQGPRGIIKGFPAWPDMATLLVQHTEGMLYVCKSDKPSIIIIITEGILHGPIWPTLLVYVSRSWVKAYSIIFYSINIRYLGA